jgi:hypothetical protein
LLKQKLWPANGQSLLRQLCTTSCRRGDDTTSGKLDTLLNLGALTSGQFAGELENELSLRLAGALYDSTACQPATFWIRIIRLAFHLCPFAYSSHWGGLEIQEEQNSS